MAWESENNNNNNGKKPVIGIGLPFYGDVSVEFVIKTYIPLVNAEPWCDKITILSRAPSLPQVRNTMVEQALMAKCDYLFFIDSDVIFEKDNYSCLKKLYEVQKPIVSGIYRAKKHDGFSLAAWLAHTDHEKKVIEFKPVDPKYLEDETNICQVDLVGMGCCLINMDVFRNTPQPWFHWDTNKEHSEDFYFCMKAAKHLGEEYFPWVHMGVKASHIGQIVIQSDGSFRTIKFDENAGGVNVVSGVVSVVS